MVREMVAEGDDLPMPGIGVRHRRPDGGRRRLRRDAAAPAAVAHRRRWRVLPARARPRSRCPVLVVTSRQDHVVEPANSRRTSPPSVARPGRAARARAQLPRGHARLRRGRCSASGPSPSRLDGWRPRRGRRRLASLRDLAGALLASIPSPSSGAIHIGSLQLRMYGLMIALGVIAAVWLAGRRFEEKGIGTRDQMASIALWAVPAGVIGARLYHVITDWQLFRDDPIRIFYIWEGGLGIWGGIALGVAVGAVAGAKLGIPLLPGAGRRGAGAAAGPGHRPARATGGTRSCSAGRRRCRGAWRSRRRNRPDGLRAVRRRSTRRSCTRRCGTWRWCVVLIWIDRKGWLRPGRLFVVYVAGYTFARFFIEGLRIDTANKIARPAGERVGVGGHLPGRRRVAGGRHRGSTATSPVRRAPAVRRPSVLRPGRQAAGRGDEIERRRGRRPGGWDASRLTRHRPTPMPTPDQVTAPPDPRRAASAGESPANRQPTVTAGESRDGARRGRGRLATSRPGPSGGDVDAGAGDEPSDDGASAERRDRSPPVPSRHGLTTSSCPSGGGRRPPHPEPPRAAERLDRRAREPLLRPARRAPPPIRTSGRSSSPAPARASAPAPTWTCSRASASDTQRRQRPARPPPRAATSGTPPRSPSRSSPPSTAPAPASASCQALMCDLRFAAAGAKFTTAFARRGPHRRARHLVDPAPARRPGPRARPAPVGSGVPRRGGRPARPRQRGRRARAPARPGRSTTPPTSPPTRSPGVDGGDEASGVRRPSASASIEATDRSLPADGGQPAGRRLPRGRPELRREAPAELRAAGAVSRLTLRTRSAASAGR